MGDSDLFDIEFFDVPILRNDLFFKLYRSVVPEHARQPGSKGTLTPMRLSWLPLIAFLIYLSVPRIASAQMPMRILPADERYKVDILLVVAHPDDEGAATPYLARAMDEGKHVAIAYGTRGSSGANEAGPEQAAALGDIREIEARRAAAVLGIDKVWFLGGKDTASQDVLQSLSNWDHGMALENLVRIVRLTRPEVILTFLPGTFIGEDHGDHQAAGVLATEAFDMAGDPTAFPNRLRHRCAGWNHTSRICARGRRRKFITFQMRQTRNISGQRPQIFRKRNF